MIFVHQHRGELGGLHQCHAGYGWDKADMTFRARKMWDCLVCHDWSNTYVKGAAGLPEKGAGAALLTAARSVGYPKRENCGTCHFFRGGGLGVDAGDLGAFPWTAPAPKWTYMRARMVFYVSTAAALRNTKSPDGPFPSAPFIVTASITRVLGLGRPPHKDERLNRHTARVACATCHIPTFARNVPTKMEWDWSKAGDGSRPEDPHHYLKIKGEFVYANDVPPGYHWFNLSVDRYLLGDQNQVPGRQDSTSIGPLATRGTRAQRVGLSRSTCKTAL